LLLGLDFWLPTGESYEFGHPHSIQSPRRQDFLLFPETSHRKTPKNPKGLAKMDDDRGRGAGRLQLNDSSSIVESISVNNCIEAAAAAHKKPKEKRKKEMKETVM
jgi:hypothetical protein